MLSEDKSHIQETNGLFKQSKIDLACFHVYPSNSGERYAPSLFVISKSFNIVAKSLNVPDDNIAGAHEAPFEPTCPQHAVPIAQDQ